MLHLDDIFPASKPSKYLARKTTTPDGITHDSQREAARWVHLQTQQRAGLISGLRRQVRFPIIINGHRVCAYVADFCYLSAGQEVVEDVKSPITRKLPAYRLKVKLMLAVHGITISEVM